MAFLRPRVRGRILDMGGGRGAYAKALTLLGHSVTVAEMNPESLAASAALGLDTIDMNKVAWETIEGRFDTVIAIEVLEHVDNPSLFLQHLTRCAPTILLTVPCTDDFAQLFRWNLTYHHVAVSDHLHHYTQKDIAHLFSQAGCKAKISVGTPLFPDVVLTMLQEILTGRPLALAALWPLRALRKFGRLPQALPSRIFVEARRESDG